MNILLTLAYRGTRYHGFQVQENAVTVCSTLQDAMEAVLHARPDVKGCSRTDAGVHARAFCLSFVHEGALPCEKLPLALNAHLPMDIRVLHARPVPAEFHARYSASGKEYQYHILNSPIDDPFTQGLYYRVPHPLDEGAMHEAGQALIGRHDFAAFKASGSSVTDTVRTITALSVKRRGQSVTLTVAADGFLYNMVRIIAGTLLLAGQGRLSAEGVAAALASRDRYETGATLPAKGLFLNRVFYRSDDLQVL